MKLLNESFETLFDIKLSMISRATNTEYLKYISSVCKYKSAHLLIRTIIYVRCTLNKLIGVDNLCTERPYGLQIPQNPHRQVSHKIGQKVNV